MYNSVVGCGEGHGFVNTVCDAGEECSGVVDVSLHAVDSSDVIVAIDGAPIEPNVCVFSPPVSECGRVVKIFNECIEGFCSCVNVVGDAHCDLKPCRVGHFLFNGECSLPYGDVLKIWNGLCDGFKVVDEGFDSAYECGNYLSITEPKFRDEMSELLRKELSEGKVALCEGKPQCVHALGAVPKSDGRLRPITDCSMPEGSSVNNFMLSTCHEFKYNSVNDVTRDLVRGDCMCVIDIASAYRSVPIFPGHSKFLGFKWDFQDGEGEVYLQENRLSFGLKCAPYIFDLLSNLAVDMARVNGAARVVNYLDDFLVAEATEPECAFSQNILLSVLRSMGFAISWKKVSTPATKTVFLGICVDSESMTLSLPEDKIVKLVDLLDDLLAADRVSKKQLERLGGLLAHFSSVIRGGRTFCRRIYDLFASCRKGGYVKLSEEIKLDLSWWRNLCGSFNGSAKIIGKDFSTSITTDASIEGFGGWSEGDWFWGSWDGRATKLFVVHDHMVPPPSDFGELPRNINVFELFAVLVGLRRWGPHLGDTLIQIVTDNNQVRYMINTGRSANKICMSWLREIFWLCFVFNVDLYAVYISSRDNVFADALSRLSDARGRDLTMEIITNHRLCCHLHIQDHQGMNYQLESQSFT